MGSAGFGRLKRACAAFWVASGLWPGWVVAQQEPHFRVEVSLVRILATVRDESGAVVGDLNREDFQVYDSGILQEIALFERSSELPVSVVLLIDVSASVAVKLREGQAVVREFLEVLLEGGHPRDAVALYTFCHDVVAETGFTRDYRRLARLTSRLRTGAGTSLYDAVWFASRALEDRPGRHLILLVTDGADTTSVRTFQEALQAAHKADAVVYGILLVPVSSEAGRHLAGEHALISLATSTGGRVFKAFDLPGLRVALGGVLEEMRAQYLLGYYPRGVPEQPGGFHPIRVEVRRSGLQVLARSGYYRR